jgi:alkylhydroperoxidase family enzyme
MLEFAVQITRDATGVSRATLDDLRSHGFSDQGILQITLIASWFNYINRVADALGVGRDAPGTAEALPIPAPATWTE